MRIGQRTAQGLRWRFVELSYQWRKQDERARVQRLAYIDEILDEHNAAQERDVCRRAGLL